MTSGFYSYGKLINKSTPYAKKMTRLSNQIFGNVVTPQQKSFPYRKMVELIGSCPWRKHPEMCHYYPRHEETHDLMKNLRDYGLYRDEHQDFTEEMRRLKALRGKPSRYRPPGTKPKPEKPS